MGNAQVIGVDKASHLIVEHDLAGCTAALQWLAYVPAALGSLPCKACGIHQIGRFAWQ